MRGQTQAYLTEFWQRGRVRCFWFQFVYFGIFSFGNFCWFFFLPVFFFYSCIYNVVGTEPETIPQRPHFAFVCFLTLAWGWFCMKSELSFSVCLYIPVYFLPITFHFRVLTLKDTRRTHWLQRLKYMP